ncbi:MAG: metal ABC transporter substrate-binding protein [Albidovulum sp.]|nr:metal ABC transporter substrate-binding protein [Albidovulum sp.]MDE0303858.1 metal ABC transporter substrate-binding protein [Albidovulum sp.]MDE0532707.1 metal ABC transporter substrate-binding protein [Albidovulum sp.]
MTLLMTLLKSVAALVALSFSAIATAQEREPVPVVATFSILGDMAERIGGEHVTVTTLVGPDGDAHVYQPTPAAARAVSEAEILIVNGLEFEGWLDRLAEAAAFDGALVVATAGIEPIAFKDEHGHGFDDHGEDHAEGEHDDDHVERHAANDGHGPEDHAGHDHGAYDPHAWQSLKNAVIYVDNITSALAKADPANAAAFYGNRADFVAEIEALDAEIHAMMAAIPKGARTVVTSHDAFQYFGRDYGLTFLSAQGVSTESEASAQDVARLIEQMRAEGITAAFVENIADPRLLEQIANETGAAIGGTLYPGALSDSDGPAASYLDMMRHNATTIAAALGS